MKAINKKYGKSKWIDTKFSRHYVVELAQALSFMYVPTHEYLSQINAVHEKWKSWDKI